MQAIYVLAKSYKSNRSLDRMSGVIKYKEAIAVGLVILYASLIREPHLRLPEVAFADKWSHLLAYALLGATLAWDLIRTQQKTGLVWLIGMSVPMVYGGAIEIVQGAFFYPRVAEWMDWIADVAGTIIGCGLVAGVWQLKNSNI